MSPAFGRAAATEDEWEPRPVPWDGVISRLQAATVARRLVPTELALIGTDLLYRARLGFSPSRTSAARASMAVVLGGTSRAAEVTRLAPLHVAARARGWELTWRAWELERIPVRNEARLREARASGRGLMLSKSHLGPLAAWVPLGRMLGGMLGGMLPGPLLLPADDWLLDPPKAGSDGYRVEHRRRVFHAAGIRLIPAAGCGMTLYKVLRKGGAVLMSMDMPGERRIRFLDKPVDMADGTAVLATKSDALVLPVALMPLGRRWEIQIGEALDPRDFADADELHMTLASIHEKMILAVPEHLENPLWRWPKATPEGWYHE